MSRYNQRRSRAGACPPLESGTFIAMFMAQPCRRCRAQAGRPGPNADAIPHLLVALVAGAVFVATAAAALGTSPAALRLGEPVRFGVSSAFAAVATIQLCPGNRLIDPGFEEGFARRGRPDVVLPNGWEEWFERLPGIDGLNYPPSYRPIRDPAFVGAGLWSLEQGTLHSTHTGGVLQQVDVGRDVWVRALAWSSAWASLGLRPEASEPPGTYATAIGIDPFGGTDAGATQIIWSQPITTTDTWIEHRLEVTVQGPIVTLFTRGQPLRILPNNVSRWDGLCLLVLGLADSTPDPIRDPSVSAVLATPPSPDAATDTAAGLYATATARGIVSDDENPFNPESGTIIGAAATLAAASTRVAAGPDPETFEFDSEDLPTIGFADVVAENLAFVALAGALFFAGLIFGMRGDTESSQDSDMESGPGGRSDPEA